MSESFCGTVVESTKNNFMEVVLLVVSFNIPDMDQIFWLVNSNFNLAFLPANS